MNRLSTAKRTEILAAFCEGASINATSRMTGVSKVTILKLLGDIGPVCLDYQRKTFVDLPCKSGSSATKSGASSVPSNATFRLTSGAVGVGTFGSGRRSAPTPSSYLAGTLAVATPTLPISLWRI